MDIDNTTDWVFVSASNEDRHFIDLVDCALAVSHFWGIPASKFHFYVDICPLSIKSILNAANIAPVIHLLGDILHINQDLPTSSTLSIVVSGHGNEDAIYSHSLPKPLTPFNIMESISQIATLNRCWLILGQCFSGIFNFTECRRGENLEFIQFGSTGYCESISMSVSNLPLAPHTNIVPMLGNYSANIFLYFIARWLAQPSDVDGDGVSNTTDCYRFACIKTGKSLNSMRIQLRKNIEQKIEDLKTRQSSFAQSGVMSVRDQIIIASLKQSIDQLSSLLFTMQEPWILNANTARRTNVA